MALTDYALKKVLLHLPQMELSEEVIEKPHGPTQVSILKHIRDLQSEISKIKRNLERKTKELANIQSFNCLICGTEIYWLGGPYPSFCERCNKTRKSAYHAAWSQRKRDHLRDYKRRWRKNRRKLAIPMEIEPPKELPPWIKDSEE